MTRIVGAVSLASLLSLPSFGRTDSLSAPRGDSLFLRVIVPETDTTLTTAGRQRISASTLPTAMAFINGKETKVYASGAFCGVVSVPFGSSSLRLSVYSPAGDSLVKIFHLQRPDPPKASPKDPAVIDTIMMEPSQDLWLGKDDILEVKLKGSPGYKVVFDLEGIESGIPMTELPLSQAGLPGIYVGRYKVKEDDEAKDIRIRYRLKKSFFSSEKAFSKSKISIIPRELPRVVEVTRRRPYLNAGLGSDRLGGAKLGSLQSGVRLVVIGKVGDQYRVQLAEGVEAWLPEEFAVLLPSETPHPHSLVGSLNISGNEKEDIVSVSLNQRLPYLSQQSVNPTEIIVDIFGATSNTNWIAQQLSGRGIRSVVWNQVAAGRYRLTITLRYQQHWGYDIIYDNGPTMRIVIRRPPVISSTDSAIAGLRIALDAGHGGDNMGALGSTGLNEKDVTLSVVQHLDSLLTLKGANVILTRNSDTSVSMAARTERVLSSGAQILVSVHANSIGNNSDPELTKGTSAYYRHVGYQPLASIMYAKMLELGLDQFGVVGSFNFTLNAPTQLPNVLVEMAFLSNPEDEMLLLDDSFRRRVANQIVKGLQEFITDFAERK